MSRLSKEAIAYSAAALEVGNVNEALAVRNREFEQDQGTFDDSSKSIVDYILRRTPKLLDDCPAQMLEPLRIAAAMMELWGENDIRHSVTIEGKFDYRFEPDAVAQTLHSHGCFLTKLEDFRCVGILRVQLLGARDPADCANCRAAEGGKFYIDEVPELPLAGCTCSDRYGCRVIVIADADKA